MDINNINYIDYGKDKKGSIVLLHGWGQNIEMMDMLGKPFEENFRIIAIDFPGFGKSKQPDTSLGVEDYADTIKKLLEKLKVNNPVLIGHSFGGRVSICYASKYETSKVVLLSSPFRPMQKKLPLKSKIYKLIKKLNIKWLTSYVAKMIGSTDYNNASEVMKGVLVKAVNEDLTQKALKINCPVLLIYGDNDEAVPLSEGKALEKLIPDAGLVIYENATHYAYLEQLNKTIAIIDSFIN